MTTAVVSAYEAATFKDIAQMMTERGFSALPVVGDGHRVIGVVSEADLLVTAEHEDDGWGWLARIGRGGRSRVRAHALTAGELMSAPPITVGPDASVAEAARVMHRHGVKRLPVVDEHGYLLGIVSRRDLLKVFTRGDDEIRAEICEEVVGHLLGGDAETVAVEVDKGVVTLTGRVAEQRLIPAAVRVAAATDGVVEVIDRLTVPATT
ncbi:MAG TPA: CBS domain-containing protein [Streptosporangiaceae bacterium]|jgi:CBS domain-containing protein